MRLDRRFLIVVGCSLLWALIVASLFYRVASRNRSGPPVHSTKPLVVAVQALPIGAVLGPDSLKIVDVPETLFPKGGFSRKEEVLDRSVVSPIEAEEPIMDARIAAKGGGIGLAPMIPPGLRAVSVRVNDVVGVAGFVLPGMRVDVLVTGRPPGRDESVTSTVLQNIPVISAGQTIQADSKSQPISTAVVTLLVNPAQAEALTLANNEGHIQLVLRNSSDQELVRTGGSRSRELYGSGTPAPVNDVVDMPPVVHRKPAAVSPPPPVPVTHIAAPVAQHSDEVIMIRGNVKTLETTPKTVN